MLASATSAAASTSYAVIGTVNVGSPLSDGLVVDHAHSSVYVVNPNANQVSVIDTTTNTVKATIGVGAAPFRIALDPGLDRAYVTNVDGGSVSVIDTSTNTVVSTIGGFPTPRGVAVDPTTHLVYVTDYYGNQMLSVVDPTTTPVTRNDTDILESRPWAVDVDPTTHRAYPTTLFGGTLSTVSGTTILHRLYAFGGPTQVTVDPASKVAYVAHSGGIAVVDISNDTAAVTGTVTAGTQPSDVAIDPGTHLLYVTNYGSNTVSVIDQASKTLLATVPVGVHPSAVEVDLVTHRAYVVSGNTVSVIAPLASQDISFTSVPPSGATLGDSYTVAADGGGSGQPVTFSVDPATTNNACSVVGSAVSFDHAGSCVIAAKQAGNSSYSAAPTASQTVVVGQLAQAITFTSVAPSDATVGGGYAVAADGGGSGQPVTFTVDPAATNNACSVVGSAVSFDHAGSCVIAADQAGSNDYAAAPAATQTVPVGQLGQAITFTSVPPSGATVGGGYAVAADGGGSGQPVTFTVDPATTNNACSVVGSAVSFDHAGSCVIAADQAGDADHSAAPAATQQLAVGLEATTTVVTLPSSHLVFGQPATATVAVDGTHAGSVQFSVDGTPVGSPVALAADGTATSPELTGSDLAVGAHQVGAVLIPTDANRYAGSTATPQTLTVGQAATTSSVSVRAHAVTATVTPTSPGAGDATGTVRFYVAGTQIGSALLSDGTATLFYAVPSGTTQKVSAVYAGDTSFSGSSASTARRDPVITAHVSSTKAPRNGWYAAPVTVTFSCKQTSAALTKACPAPVTLSRNAAGQSVTRTVMATDGGAATAVASGINIDTVRPNVRVTGVRAGATYFASGPVAGCRATDRLSGVASCTVTRATHGHRVSYVATATDRAGNRSHTRLVAHITWVAISGAAMRDGHYVVHSGRTYTVLVAAAKRPSYVYAAPSPRRPAGGEIPFKRIGHHRWALGVTFTKSMSSHTWWNIGTRVGSHTTVTAVRVLG